MKAKAIIKAIKALEKKYVEKEDERYSDKELLQMKQPALKKLLAELTADYEGGDDTKKVEAKETVKVPKEVFKSLCGTAFNPAKKSACAVECKPDHPEAFKACEANFKTQVVGKKAKKKGSVVGMNYWGHRNNTQASALDDIFYNGKTLTIDGICEALELSRARVTSHIKHLQEDQGKNIQKAEDGVYFWADKVQYKVPKKKEAKTKETEQ